MLVNATLVLPIHLSWSDPSELEYQLILKPKAPVFNYASLWYDEKANSLYSFGGEQSYWDKDNAKLDYSVWRLDLDGKGGGQWHKNTSDTDPPFSQGFVRPSGGSSAFTDDTAYLAGGYTSNHSSPDVMSSYSNAGVVSYSLASGTWANDTSTSAIEADGYFQWGGMEYLPRLGPNGMIVYWGGQTTGSSSYGLPGELRSMNKITLFDPVTKRYYVQDTNGRPPSPRVRFCSVSVEDPGPVVKGANKTGSWEIFMYSGYGGVSGNPMGVRDYDSIWALSIPAFKWTNIYSDMTGGRYGHSCHLIGKRQMLTVGGAMAANDVPLSTPDYLNLNGIGVFDLSQSEWMAGFDADAQPYQRSLVVQKVYDNKYSMSPQTRQNIHDTGHVLVVPTHHHGQTPSSRSSSPILHLRSRSRLQVRPRTRNLPHYQQQLGPSPSLNRLAQRRIRRIGLGSSQELR